MCYAASETEPSWDILMTLTPDGMSAEVGIKFSHCTLETLQQITKVLGIGS